MKAEDYDFHGKRVFLSGPMTGVEDWNRKAFEETGSEILWELGAKYVYSPASLAPLDGEEPLAHERYMTRTLHELTKFGPTLEDVRDWFHPNYDCIVMLPGWRDSAGARVEHDVAVAIGMEVVEL